jgi:DNA repair protein RadC
MVGPFTTSHLGEPVFLPPLLGREVRSHTERRVFMSEKAAHEGHRARVREKFLSGDAASRSDVALLELLLIYAIPQKDVQALAKTLLSRFGSLENVLAASLTDLCQVAGIKQNSAVLLKLVDAVQRRNQVPTPVAPPQPKQKLDPAPRQAGEQRVLLPLLESAASPQIHPRPPGYRKPVARYGSELFGKAVLKEAIDMLPKLPDSDSLDDARAFLRSNLHFSGEQTRQRYAAYITRRMFPDGIADAPLRHFARAFPASTELRDVCYYRFCKAEPVMPAVVSNVFLPALGLGRIRRERIAQYLQHKFPESKAVSDCVTAIVEVLVAGGIASADRKQITFGARPIRNASLAFILHSEFPEPGMYEVGKAETSALLSSLLWTPEKILAALYELRNVGLISKISEIDSIRQFTLKFDLAGLVSHLARGAKTP